MPGVSLVPIQSYENIIYLARETLWGDPAPGVGATNSPFFALRTLELQTTPRNETVSLAGERVGTRDIYSQPPVAGREGADGTIPTFLRADTGMLFWLLVMGSMSSEAADPAAQTNRWKHVIRCALRPGSATLRDFQGGRNDNVRVVQEYAGCDFTTARLTYNGDENGGAIRADYSFMGTFPYIRGHLLTDERQTVTIVNGSAGPPTGGTFTLTLSAQSTGPIPFNATAGVVQIALEEMLEALDGVGVGSVFVTGGPGPSTPYVVYFVGRRATTNAALMTATTAFTGGGTVPSPTVTVAETEAGGLARTNPAPTDARAFASWQPVSTLILPTRFRAAAVQETRLQQFSLTFDNGLAEVKSAVGERSPQGHTFGGRAVTGTITRFIGPPEDERAIVASTLLNDTEIFREMNRTKETFELNIEAAGNSIIHPTGNGYERRDRFKIRMPKLMLNGDPERTDFNGSLVETLPWISYLDEAAIGGPLEITFWNAIGLAGASPKPY